MFSLRLGAARAARAAFAREYRHMHIRARFVVALLWLSSGACLGQPEQQLFQIVPAFSVCIDPPQVEVDGTLRSLTARDEADKLRFQGPEATFQCKRWSQFGSTLALLPQDKFASADGKMDPVSRFAQRIVQVWTGLQKNAPTPAQIIGDPGAYGLRPLRPGESRVDSMMVWPGMIGVVVADGNEFGVAQLDLARIQLLHSDRKNGGRLRPIDVSAIEPRALDGQYHFYTAIVPRFFWNQWIVEQDTPDDSLEPGNWYRYRIELSPLDFDRLVSKPGYPWETSTLERANQAIADLRDMKVLVIPFGGVHLVGDDKSYTADLDIDKGRLRNLLQSPSIAAGPTQPAALAERFGVLRTVLNDGQSQLSLSFRVEAPGDGDASSCAGLAVVIWRQPSAESARVIGSWSRSFSVAAAGSASASANAACGDGRAMAIRLDPVAIPRFAPRADSAPAARLSFLDLGEVSVATFEEGRNLLPTHWVLERSHLRDEMTRIVGTVDKTVDDRTFDIRSISEPLETILFACRARDVVCGGQLALQKLRMLAGTGQGSRVEASFHDSKGAAYYVPLHLVAADAERTRLLGDRLRIVLPMPVSKATGGAALPCVKTWTAGMVVSDSNVLDEAFRSGWLKPLLEQRPPHAGASYVTLDALKKYFREGGANAGPEALVLLAHHGSGDIADRQLALPTETIVVDDVRHRTLAPGSFGLLSMCSIGALGEHGIGNGVLLDVLGRNNLQAAVISPFAVPPILARRFLEQFRQALLDGDRQDGCKANTLRGAFACAKELIRKSNEAQDTTPMMRFGSDLFMLVGDGSLQICPVVQPQ